MALPDESRNRVWPDLAAIIAAAILVTLPVVLFGIPKGNDLPQHYQFAVTFYESAKDDVFFPGWSANVNSGFGDIGVRFYPPLAYYVLDFFRVVFGSWYYGSVATFWFWFFLGGSGVYFWAREWFGRNASLAAAIAYIFIPYHVNEIYNAFTYAEFAAAAILPFCFLFVTRVCNRGKLSDSLGLTISFALLVLANLPLAVIGSIALLVYSLATIRKETWFASLIRLGGSVGMGLLATAFYWVRMASELSFLNHDAQQFLSRAYDFRQNFLLSFFNISAEQYAERSLVFVDLMLLVTVMMFLSFALAYYRKASVLDRGHLQGVLAIFIFGVFFATPLSYPVWSYVEPLQKVQFPWRWMTIISLAAAIFIASGFDPIKSLIATRFRPLAMVAFGLLVAGFTFTAAQVIRPAIYLDPAEFDSMVNRLSTAQSYDCWWPIWAKKEALVNNDNVSAGDRTVEIEKWQSTTRQFRVSPGDSLKARIATFYYPNWQAEINGHEIPVTRDDNGAVVLSLPPVASEVTLYFHESVLVQISKYISIACWSILALFGAYLAFLRFRKKLN